MVRSLIALLFLAGVLSQGSAQADALITITEAALPSAPPMLSTRGITRGPSIKLLSPQADTAVTSPFSLKLSFEARGGEKIDPNSVNIVYLKSPLVDLTPRLKSAITTSGIDFPKAEVPPGEHAIQVTVKDGAGRETQSVIKIMVAK